MGLVALASYRVPIWWLTKADDSLIGPPAPEGCHIWSPRRQSWLVYCIYCIPARQPMASPNQVADHVALPQPMQDSLGV